MTFPVIIWCILASSCVLGPLTATLMSVRCLWIPLCFKAAYHFVVVFSECDVTFLFLGGLETQEGDIWPF